MSPGEERLVERLLVHLHREAGDERIRELAGEVLGGRISLIAAMRASAYAEAFEPSLSGFTNWYRNLEPQELAEHVGRCRAEIDDLADQD
ncbi:hypothetical protein AB0F81_04155 [Actinoplanes sp. NPDC024001]|uniref:hypothetical protein n=1 Tax=Actinoplanes sp. NPDC024001 TaxID=3154598 RepID=UPI0033C9438D